MLWTIHNRLITTSLHMEGRQMDSRLDLKGSVPCNTLVPMSDR